MQFDFNSAFHGIALLLCLVSYGILGGVVFYQWKIIQDLTNRLMADSYREYKTTIAPQAKQEKERKPRDVDPTLGAHF